MRCRSICWRMGFVPTMCLMTSFLILSLLVLLAALLRHFISHVLIFLSVFLMIVHVWAWDLRVGVNVVPMMVLTAGWDSSGPIKKVTLFDFWHRVSISLSCLPSSVNISIPNILLNTVIIFNLNHNLVHRTLSLLIPVHFRHLLFIHDDMYMYCSVYSQTQPFPTWFIQ